MSKPANIRPATTSTGFDVAHARAQFPILQTRVNAKPLVYFDNAASAQKPESVLHALDNTYRTSYANIHRGAHYLSTLATEKYEAARERCALS
jgi:cysteine desulfurase/selenocysteine lyase